MDIYQASENGFFPSSAVSIVVNQSAKEGKVGVCSPIEHGFGGGADFGLIAQHYLSQYEGIKISERSILNGDIPILVSITKWPQHGKIVKIEKDPFGGWKYSPNESYFGKDTLEAKVVVGKKIVNVIYHFVVQSDVIEQLSDFQIKKYCPKRIWKISYKFSEEIISSS